MTIGSLIQSFAHDQQTVAIVAAILIDFVLGLVSAVLTRTFDLAYVANVARNDLLAKLVPFFLFHSFAVIAPGTNIVIPGLDLNAIATSLFLVIMAAEAGSIVKSLAEIVPGWAASVGGFVGARSGGVIDRRGTRAARNQHV